MSRAVKTKKNIDGYFAGGQFFPIRNSKGYDGSKAGDQDDIFDKEIRRENNRKKAEKTYQQQLENQIRREMFGDNDSASAGKTLIQFVRSLGGIRPSRDKSGKAYDAGELSEFTFKESKKRGLVSDKSRYSLDGMFQAATEEGFDVKNENDLLDKMGDELRKGKATYKTRGYIDYRDNPQTDFQKRVISDFEPLFAAALTKIENGNLRLEKRAKELGKLAGFSAREAADEVTKARLSFKLKNNPTTMKGKQLTENQIKSTAANIAKMFPGMTAAQVIKKLKSPTAAAKRTTGAKRTKRNPDEQQADQAAQLVRELIETFDVDGSGKLTMRDVEIIDQADQTEAGQVLSQTTDGEIIVKWQDGEITLEDKADLVFENGIRGFFARRKATRAFGKNLKAKRRADVLKSKSARANAKATIAERQFNEAQAKLKNNPGLLSLFSELAVGTSAAIDVAKNLKGRKTKSKTPRTRANSANKATVRRVRTNPFDAFEEFQGRQSTHNLELIKPEGCPAKLWSLGLLLELRVVGTGIINFSKEALGKDFYLCADEANTQLWITGAKIAEADNEIEAGDFEPLGEIIHVVYQTEKRHLDDAPGEPSNYKHRFGDEGGIRPTFGFDNKGFGIIDGGDYVITAAGIRN